MGEYRYVGTAVLEEKARKVLRMAVEKVAFDVVAEAQPLTRIDTGAERAGIHVASISGKGSNASSAMVTARIETSMEYDVYQHEGTRFMSGTHFLERPLLASRATLLAVLAAMSRMEF